jgi:DNA-binding Lrp family transcriptional regulator
MDALDRDLIKFLQLNGLQSSPELSSHLGMGERTVQRRMKYLRERGIIKIIAVPNMVAWGYQGWAKIGIHADPLHAEHVAKVLAHHPSVYLVDHTFGAYNIVIAVAFKTVEKLTHFVSYELNNIKGVLTKETMLFARPIKYYRYYWPGYTFKNAQTTHEYIFDIWDKKFPLLGLDMRILKILMTDGLTRPAVIKEKLGVTESIVRKRINFMKENRLITLEVIPDKDVLEGEIQATIDINTKFTFNNEMLDIIVNDPNVYLVSMSIGRFDLVIAARFENFDMLSQFVNIKLGPMQGINSIQISPHCKSIKIHNNIR